MARESFGIGPVRVRAGRAQKVELPVTRTVTGAEVVGVEVIRRVRADLDDDLTRRLATAFGAPAMLHAQIRDRSLRQAARERGAPASSRWSAPWARLSLIHI